jgi:hypothetical protein
LRARSEVGVGSLGMSARVLLIWIDHTKNSAFQQSIVWGASPNREGSPADNAQLFLSGS